MTGSLQFVGNATTVLRLGPFTLLTDPNFLHKGQWTHIGQGVVSRRLTDPAIEIADLPELDAVLLSHLHGDHFDRVASRELARHLPVFTTPHAAKRLPRRGFREAAPLRTWETVALSRGAAKLTVTSLPGAQLLAPRTTVPVHYEEYGVMKSPLSDFTAEISRRRAGFDVQVVARGPGVQGRGHGHRR